MHVLCEKTADKIWQNHLDLRLRLRIYAVPIKAPYYTIFLFRVKYTPHK